MAERIGLRAYARHRKEKGLPGSSPAGVSKAIKDGRIARGADGLIDPVQADAEWLQNTAAPDPVAPEASPKSGTRAALNPGAANDFVEARARKEQALAEQHQLKLSQMRGELVTVDFMRRELRRLLELIDRIHDRAIAGWPPKLSAVGGGDANAFRDFLRGEIQRMRKDLAELGIGDDADPSGRPLEVA